MKWIVELPITGFIRFDELEADTEEEAIARAFALSNLVDYNYNTPTRVIIHGEVSNTNTNDVAPLWVDGKVNAIPEFDPKYGTNLKYGS